MILAEIETNSVALEPEGSLTQPQESATSPYNSTPPPHNLPKIQSDPIVPSMPWSLKWSLS
jgi:hypothetical protein